MGKNHASQTLRTALFSLSAVITLLALVVTQGPLPAAATPSGANAVAAGAVTPKGPTFRDEGSAVSVYIPSDAGVRYYIYVGESQQPVVKEGLAYSKPGTYTSEDGVTANAVIRVEARSAGSSTVLTGTLTWSHALVTADQAPQFSDENTTITLPQLPGATFAVNGTDASGTVSGQQGQTATVTARSTQSNDEVGVWTHKFPTLRTPEAPEFNASALTVRIPYGQSGVRYYIHVGEEKSLVAKDGLDYSKPGTYSAADGLSNGADVAVSAKPASSQDLVVGQSTWKTHFFSDGQAPVFDDAQAKITIPEVSGIVFTVGENVIEPGTHQYASGESVDVAARFSADGEVIRSWEHAFPAAVPTVTPKGPTFRDDISAVYIPSDAGVRYYIYVGNDTQPVVKDGLPYSKPGTYSLADGVVPGQVVRVEARAAGSSPQLSGTVVWRHLFFDEASSPAFDDKETTVTIPDVAGVKFSINGAQADAGRHEMPGGSNVSVVARLADGTSDDVLGSWQHKFGLVLTPRGPAFRDDVSTLTIPSDPGVRYYIYVGDSNVTLSKDASQDFAKPGTYTSSDGLVADQPIRVEAKPVSASSILSGTTSWEHVFPAKTPIGPTFRDDGSSVYIPSDSGIRYYIYVGDSDVPLSKDASQNFSKPGTYTESDGVSEGVRIRVEARPVSATAILSGKTEWEHIFPKRPTYSLTSGDGFDDPSELLAKDWSVYRNAGKGLPRGQNTVYLASNVKVKDGKLELITKRHCVRVDGDGKVDEDLSDENVSEKPCEGGKRSVFSSGRVSTDFIYNSAAHGTQGPFTMEVRARMSDGTIPGLHFAGWVRNNQPYCSPTINKSDIAEIDTMEVFTDPGRQFTTNTSHIGCEGKSSTDTNRNYNQLDAQIAGAWHTYRMEWNGYSIRYFLDGVPVPLRYSPHSEYETTAASLGLSDADFNRMMNDYPWQLIFDSRVFEDKTGWIPGPNHNAAFKTRTDVVDYVTMTPVQSVAPYGAIGAKWRDNQWLGSPQSAEATDVDGTGARFQTFQNGAIFWSPDTGAVMVSGAIRDTYLGDASVRSAIGLPTGTESKSADGRGAYQPFQRGQMHWSPQSGAHATRGAVQDYWAHSGWEFGALGYPIGEELAVKGGASQRFEGGTVFWSPSSQAHLVKAAVLDEYAATGWEGGELGFPLTDEIGGLRDGGVFQSFQKGQIHWSSGTGAHATRGAINSYWGANNWENSYAGYPVGDELSVRGGASQRFESATLFWDQESGRTFGTRGAIRQKYESAGWEQGELGFPSSDERALSGGASQSFRSGSQIHWSPSTGGHITKGAIQGIWAAQGWETGRLGYPTTDERDDPGTPGGKVQSFSGGEIHWSPNSSYVS
ncbi:family 16 glycosylhydrolase [Pseudoclavibacter sp. CFCC 14310]|uniref:family 16 glycosylhydrolase n=1 Tax=Pseudoclavibacter sp. CFCC 14310 TaxID=2615180 RepID=UPI001301727D|nr:family 16 glycosylhydrolase [Pseudoclavibacter sp. CFCC 14310]KAB1647021.1 family 16 glycosylhydrolase [Pseudoclavibacter sp. CFCC 14310]